MVMSALRTGRTLLHRKIIIFMFLVLISVLPEELGEFKKSHHPVSYPRPSGL
jgi:hypothetical protein